MPADDLSGMPGYLARRLRQIAVSLFAERAGAFGVTTQQYTTLEALDGRPGLEQHELCACLHLDGSTMATLLVRLEDKGLVKRWTAKGDKRRRHIALTPRGDRMLASMRPALASVQTDLLAPLEPDERALFVQLLRKIVDRHADEGTERAIERAS